MISGRINWKNILLNENWHNPNEMCYGGIVSHL